MAMSKTIDLLEINTDGGSRGNPGQAAIGVVATSSGEKVFSLSERIGETTNNVAEYTAVVEALTWIINHTKNTPQFVSFFLDSALVVNQLNGLFKVKDEKMRSLMLTVRQLEQQLDTHITYESIPRALNAAADAKVNEALDAA